MLRNEFDKGQSSYVTDLTQEKVCPEVFHLLRYQTATGVDRGGGLKMMLGTFLNNLLKLVLDLFLDIDLIIVCQYLER